MEDKTSIEVVAELLPRLSAQQREVQDFVEFLLQETPQQKEVQTSDAVKQRRRGGLGIARGKIRIAENFKSVPEGFNS